MKRASVCTIAALLPLTVAVAADPPEVKEGLWEVHGQSVENPGEVKSEFEYKLCRNHAYDKAATAMLKSVKGCNTVLKDLKGGRFASASTCSVAGTTIVSNGVTTYVSDVSIHAETSATYTPAFKGKAAETMTQDQQFIGDCPAGMKPGETLDADGVIRHHG